VNNTLLLGNGINRNIYPDAKSWQDLFKDAKDFDVDNCTFLYEACLLNSKDTDNEFKDKLVKELKEKIRPEKINKSKIKCVDTFGMLLQKHHINNLITTNVDTGIESILTVENGYAKNGSNPNPETVYSIRRKKSFTNGKHELNLWKIHGDVKSIASVSLGFDQYCGSLAKIESYVKGKYDRTSVKCKTSMELKIKNKTFDNVSWIELFFNTNVYIACFGLAFSEIDLWWILNKRCRLKKKGVSIKNKIYYLYSEYDTGEKLSGKEGKIKQNEFEQKKNMLERFDVKLIKIQSNEELINNIFNQIKT